MKLTNKISLFLTFVSILVLSLNILEFTVFAEEIVSDGKYEIEFDSDMPSMGLSAFENKEKKAIVEKIGDNYYLTISVNPEVVKEFKMLGSEMKVGETVKTDGSAERHTFTVTKEQLNSVLKYSCKVIAMDRKVEFTVEPKLETAKRVGEADTSFERPALFVPVIETAAGGGEIEKGSTYIIPKINSTIGKDILETSVKVYYIDKGNKTEVDVKEGKFVFAKAGEYHLVLRAESDKYKTSEGNNTFAELDIKFISKIGASSVGGYEDKNGILPKGSQMQASVIKNGEIFEKVQTLMKGYADNFQVINVDFYSPEGEKITLSGEIKLALRADDTFDRQEVKVFLLSEDGSLKEYAKENYGRYIKLDTDKTGTYVLLVEGTEFHMPMWAYAVIIAGVLAIAAIVTVIIIKVKKKA